MVLSEVSGIVDDLAKAAAKADEDRQRKEEEENREVEKEVGEKTYAAVAAAAVPKGQEQEGEVGAEIDVRRDEREPVIEGEVVGSSVQDHPETEPSVEQISPPGEEGIMEEMRATQAPGETVLDDSADSMTTVVDVEVPPQAAEDGEASDASRINEGPLPEQKREEEIAETVERKSNEGDDQEDDIGEGVKEIDEGEPEITQEGAEGEGANEKSGSEVTRETT